MKIVISDTLAREGLEILAATPGLEIDYRPGLHVDELKKALSDSRGLIVRSATKVTSDLLDAAPNLQIIGRAGTGLDNVDVDSATTRGIVVMNTPGGNAQAVAELTIGLMMAMARGIPAGHHALQKGKWIKKDLTGREVFNKTLGIIGIGAIGSRVARYAMSLRMNVVAYDPHISLDAASRLGVELTDLEDLVARADFISIHVPLIPETTNLVDAELLSQMKPTAMLINTSRGGIVDEAALAEALREGRLAGAAVDVFKEEPLSADNPLVGIEQVVLTPHIGASTIESQVEVGVQICRQIAHFFLDGVITNAVNFPQVPPETLRAIRPYLTLGERLGSFLGQLSAGRMDSLAVSYQGLAAALPTAPITNAVVMGLLQPIIGEGVNMINANVIAKERGLMVQEARGEESVDYTTLIEVSLRTTLGERSVSGTLFGQSEPRIVSIDDFPIEAEPSGHLLFLINRDTPGVIGKLGTILGEAGVNIAGLSLGRPPSGERALSLLNVDTPVPQEILDHMVKMPAVEEVHTLHFGSR